jgi:hypothetical protein
MVTPAAQSADRHGGEPAAARAAHPRAVGAAGDARTLCSDGVGPCR